MLEVNFSVGPSYQIKSLGGNLFRVDSKEIFSECYISILPENRKLQKVIYSEGYRNVALSTNELKSLRVLVAGKVGIKIVFVH